MAFLMLTSIAVAAVGYMLLVSQFVYWVHTTAFLLVVVVLLPGWVVFSARRGLSELELAISNAPTRPRRSASSRASSRACPVFPSSRAWMLE